MAKVKYVRASKVPKAKMVPQEELLGTDPNLQKSFLASIGNVGAQAVPSADIIRMPKPEGLSQQQETLEMEKEKQRAAIANGTMQRPVAQVKTLKKSKYAPSKPDLQYMSAELSAGRGKQFTKKVKVKKKGA